MTRFSELAEAQILQALGSRLAGLRLARNQSQDDLAREAGVSARTLARLEAGASTQLGTLLRVLRVLGLLDRLNELLPEPGPGPLELLRLEKGRRRRASRPKKDPKSTAADNWSWGDESDERPAP